MAPPIGPTNIWSWFAEEIVWEKRPDGQLLFFKCIRIRIRVDGAKYLHSALNEKGRKWSSSE